MLQKPFPQLLVKKKVNSDQSAHSSRTDDHVVKTIIQLSQSVFVGTK